MINNEMKRALNVLQYHVDRDYDEARDILLIFDNQRLIDLYKQEVGRLIDKGLMGRDYLEDIVIITMYDLLYKTTLTGRRFNQYHFMIDEEIRYEN